MHRLLASCGPAIEALIVAACRELRARPATSWSSPASWERPAAAAVIEFYAEHERRRALLAVVVGGAAISAMITQGFTALRRAC